MGKCGQTAGKTVFLSLSSSLLFALGGCMALEPMVETIYMKSPTAQVVGAQALDGDAVIRKHDTGIYPTFTQPLTAACSQMTHDEASKIETNLSRLGAAQRNWKFSEAEYKRRVAELHSIAEKQVPVITPASQ